MRLGLGITTKGARRRGPELVTTPFGSWVMAGTTPPTQDATGITFNGTTSNATGQATINAMEDNATYEVTFTIANYVSGIGRVFIYGATTAHGAIGSNRSANGTFTELLSTSAAGSFTKQVRVQSNGASNNFKVTYVSVKKVS